jgi:hypothetical protein
MTKLSLIAIGVLVTICSAHAQLGWTLQQCKDKFGIQPTQEDANEPRDYDFTLPHYKVTVTMNDKGVVTDVWFWPLQVLGGLDLALLDSTEIKSWQGPPINGEKDGNPLSLNDPPSSQGKEFMGLVWKRFKELEMAPPLHSYLVWIAYKKGKPVIDLTLNKAGNGDIQSVWLEATSASQLAQAIEDAKADGGQTYEGQ